MGLRTAAPEPLGPRDGSQSAPGGFEMAPRALREASRPSKTSKKLRSEPLGPRNRCSGATGASRRLQERSGRPQDGPKNAPGDCKTAPRALREPPRRPQERSGRLQDGPKSALGGSRRPQERSRRLQDGLRVLREASRRLQERSGRLKTAPRALGRPQDDSHRRSSFSK